MCVSVQYATHRHTFEDIALTYIDYLQACPNLNDNQLMPNTGS